MNLAIECRGVTQQFGSFTAVDSVDLKVPAGQIVALLGPNGAGKTTLIDMMLGLTEPRRGEVSLFGMKPRKAISLGLVGATQQSATVPDIFTVRSVLEATAALWVNPVSVDDLISAFDMSAIAKRKVKKLSGGEQQRVRTALALISNPDLLFLDEPTTGMDVNARANFWEIMHEFAAQGRTILFATHYLSEAQDFANQVVIMRQGRIIANGTPAQLRSQACAHLKAFISEASINTLNDNLVRIRGDRQWHIQFSADTVNISGSDLDDAARAVLSVAGTHGLTITPASLDEAFTAITKEN